MERPRHPVVGSRSACDKKRGLARDFRRFGTREELLNRSRPPHVASDNNGCNLQKPCSDSSHGDLVTYPLSKPNARNVPSTLAGAMNLHQGFKPTDVKCNP